MSDPENISEQEPGYQEVYCETGSPRNDRINKNGDNRNRHASLEVLTSHGVFVYLCMYVTYIVYILCMIIYTLYLYTRVSECRGTWEGVDEEFKGRERGNDYLLI